jgi:hypothetical protein
MQTAIGRFSSRAEAELARGLLDSVGIASYIRADDAGALHPELAQVGEKHGIALMVDPADADAAQELIDEVADEPSDWEEPVRAGRSGVGVAIVLVIALGLGFVFGLLDVITGILGSAVR